VFARLSVDYVVSGGARVSWDLNRHFVDPGPYQFQLQASHAGLPDDEPWIDVGSVVTDTYFAFDLAKRQFGKLQDVCYRVELTSALDTYVSPAVDNSGLLNKRQWLHAREIVRRELLRHRVYSSPEGLLLKARRYGPKCTSCTDEFTDEVSDSNCEECFGTGYQNGYFAPLPAFYADLSENPTREHRTPQTGMEKKDVISGRFIGDPQMAAYDVWVNKHSDERYYIHTLNTKAHIRGVPLVIDAELRLAPYTDVIYLLDLSDVDALPGRRTRSACRIVTPLPPQMRLGRTPPSPSSVSYLDKYLRSQRSG
jgi:hypothetical protein